MRSCTWVLLSNSYTSHCFHQRLIILDNIWLITFPVLREKLSIKKQRDCVTTLHCVQYPHDDSQNQSTMACTTTVPISFKIGISSLFELWFEFGWSQISPTLTTLRQDPLLIAIFIDWCQVSFQVEWDKMAGTLGMNALPPRIHLNALLSHGI